MRVKYELKDKKTEPKFRYMVHVLGEFDYYLYNEFDKAYEKMKQLAREEKEIAEIMEPYFNTVTREWMTIVSFRASRHGKVEFLKAEPVGLHMKFWMDSGEWKNPKQDGGKLAVE